MSRAGRTSFRSEKLKIRAKKAYQYTRLLLLRVLTWPNSGLGQFSCLQVVLQLEGRVLLIVSISKTIVSLRHNFCQQVYRTLNIIFRHK